MSLASTEVSVSDTSYYDLLDFEQHNQLHLGSV